MCLRKLRVHKDGKEHGYWSLVETIRTADGPRQRTLLGELNRSAHARWQKTIEVFNEHGESTQLKLFSSEAEVPDDPNVARVLVKKVRVERTRRSLARHRRPPIQFLSIGSRVCSALLSDLASRFGPCASLTLLLHQDG
jgi:hypothetical protein